MGPWGRESIPRQLAGQKTSNQQPYLVAVALGGHNTPWTAAVDLHHGLTAFWHVT